MARASAARATWPLPSPHSGRGTRPSHARGDASRAGRRTPCRAGCPGSAASAGIRGCSCRRPAPATPRSARPSPLLGACPARGSTRGRARPSPHPTPRCARVPPGTFAAPGHACAHTATAGRAAPPRSAPPPRTRSRPPPPPPASLLHWRRSAAACPAASFPTGARRARGCRSRRRTPSRGCLSRGRVLLRRPRLGAGARSTSRTPASSACPAAAAPLRWCPASSRSAGHPPRPSAPRTLSQARAAHAWRRRRRCRRSRRRVARSECCCLPSSQRIRLCRVEKRGRRGGGGGRVKFKYGVQ
eukprot:Rhum_TRINITY_DN8399_c0_g1::Rhum_TRINITY_DN8399_c0_g1_i1::g.27180::m.27180